MAAYKPLILSRTVSDVFKHWTRSASNITKNQYVATRQGSTKQEIKQLKPTETALDTEEIIIPKRIERGSTDLLKALASTLSRDYTATHYKYHDDPFLMPASNISKRTYALAKESGQKAAQWMFETYPKFFERDIAVPSIDRFIPKQKYDDKSDVSEETLNLCILSGELNNSWTVYELLKSKGVQVSTESIENLLELLCFYNCTEPFSDEHKEDKWFRKTDPHEKRKIWRGGSFAEQLFNSVETKSNKMYYALIRGMAKYYQVDKAYSLYQEMLEKGIPIDIEIYNALIPLSFFMKETGETRWQMAESFLRSIRSANLSPNLRTFNAVLDVLSRLGNWAKAKKIALETLGEMKHLGIEPSLASYYHLLNAFCKERGPTSTILTDIMKNIEGKEFFIQDPYDVYFFVNAMNVCYVHLMDRNVALSIHKLLLTGNNYNLIGDSMKESIYYQNFFKILCSTESVDDFFQYYNKLVPTVYTPEPSVILEILLSIEIHQEWKYIPQMWSDIKIFSVLSQSKILEKIAELVGGHKVEGELQKQFFDIAWDLKEIIDAQRQDKLRNIVYWTGEMLGNVMLACLNADEYKKACQLLLKTETDSSKIMGVMNAKALDKFLEASIDKNDAKAAVFCVRYAGESGITDTEKFARKVLDSLQLTEIQRIKVTEFATSNEIPVEQENQESSQKLEDPTLTEAKG